LFLLLTHVSLFIPSVRRDLSGTELSLDEQKIRPLQLYIFFL